MEEACALASGVIIFGFLFETHTLRAIQCEFPALMGRVLLAIFLSALACFIIFALDKVDDAARMASSQADGGSKLARRVVGIVINALGILVGFSWEHAFDGGVYALAALTMDPVLFKLSFAAFSAWFIVFPWRRYILVKAMILADNAEGAGVE